MPCRSANSLKVYANGVRALDGIDLDVPRGDFCALLGPNGAGKTSLIGIVTSLVSKTSGEVSVFGHDLDRELNAVKSAIGVVPQEINLNLWDKVSNIVVNQAGFYGVPPARARRRAEICLRQLQLWDRRHDSARTLSGGMKRRLMIARALMHEPELLILDEPTAGVDIEIRRSMWDFLREINAAGTTIILTTHYLEEAENLCRHVAIIDHGRVIVDDRMAAVLTRLQQETLPADTARAGCSSADHCRALMPGWFQITKSRSRCPGHSDQRAVRRAVGRRTAGHQPAQQGQSPRGAVPDADRTQGQAAGQRAAEESLQ